VYTSYDNRSNNKYYDEYEQNNYQHSKTDYRLKKNYNSNDNYQEYNNSNEHYKNKDDNRSIKENNFKNYKDTDNGKNMNYNHNQSKRNYNDKRESADMIKNHKVHFNLDRYFIYGILLISFLYIEVIDLMYCSLK